MAGNDKPFGSTPHRVIEHGAHNLAPAPDSMHDSVNHWFVYHAPSHEQTVSYNILREKARELAHLIVSECPPSADRTHAIRCLRDAIMWANASIACGGR